MAKQNLFLTVAALALAGSVVVTVFPGNGLAQSAPDDDPAEDVDDPDDDVDVPDPDDSDAGAPDAPADEPADEPADAPADDPADPAGDGEPDAGGNTDAPGDDGGSDDGGSGGGADADDGGSDGAGGGTTDADDGESETDDDGPAAPVGSGAADDDADDAGGADDDDGPAAPTGAVTDGDDDDDDDDDAANDEPATPNPGNDDDNSGSVDDDDNVLEIIGGGSETEGERIRLDERDGIETDREGFRYRDREFVALDLQPKELDALRGQGFEVVRSDRMGSLTGTLYLLRGPAGRNEDGLLSDISDIADPGALSLNHLFDSSSARVRRQGKLAPVTRTACGCRIGLIDTGVAATLPMFKHVQIEQRAFNAKTMLPRLHGTAIAYLFSGTTAKPGRRTRILAADIFAGPRETAGSTYVLVQALDWMGTQGVPVINISLSGPRNDVVAAAVKRLAAKGHVIVAAAGNDGPAAPPVFPGAYTGVVAVTAVDDRQQVYRYANRGNYIDFAAHGVNVPAMDPLGLRTSATGTSFAAPVVAARIAARMDKPDLALAKASVAALESAARDLGSPGRDTVFGQGLVEVTP